MNKSNIEDIKLFIEFWPLFQAQTNELQNMIIEEKELLLSDPAINVSWFHLYELPAHVHFPMLMKTYAEDPNLANIFLSVVNSSNQLGAIPTACKDIDNYFDGLPAPTKNESIKFLRQMAPMLGVILSLVHSLSSMLYYGRFLNDLIEQVRQGDENSLFQAISIDPTSIACKPIAERMSKAVFIKDEKFLKKVYSKLGKRPAKLAQANYQKMRLVLEILYECGSSKLSDEDLYQLFVAELKLYSWDDLNGGNREALRKFADTYMKKKATT